jgi:PhnB protein
MVPDRSLCAMPTISAMNKDAAETSLSVMLIVPDAAAAVGWYQRALGAEVLWDLGGVAGLRVGGAPFFLHEAVAGRARERSPGDAGTTTTRIELFTDGVAAMIDRAAREGAVDVEPVTAHKLPWGIHQQGGFTDPFGHRWSVGDRTPLTPHPSRSPTE